MAKKRIGYQKIFSRDFSLPSVEAWVRGESTNPKGWTQKMQPFLPYIVTQRADNTVAFFYDLVGVTWIQDLLIDTARKNRTFVQTIGTTVLKKLSYIRPIYEMEEPIGLSELKRFIKELEAGYPWFEAMWWFFQMDDETKVADFNLETLAKVRTLTDRLCNSSDVVIRKSLEQLYPELGEVASELKIEEINTGKHPSKKQLGERHKGYFFGNNLLLTGVSPSQAAKRFGITFVREVVKKTKELTGSVAYKGIAKGYVRRIMGHDQISEMKEDEILVSPMTMPDFLPAMKKASAFVTDEGGVLCHAAIVAREFRKPCIVGTKFATQVLHDGAYVLVDANKGTVTILK